MLRVLCISVWGRNMDFDRKNTGKTRSFRIMALQKYPEDTVDRKGH